MYRHTGEDGEDADLDDPLARGKNPVQAMKELKKKKKKKKKDLSINQVEDLKQNLQNHLAELNKLFGKNRANQQQLFDQDDGVLSDDSDEDEALAK